MAYNAQAMRYLAGELNVSGATLPGDGINAGRRVRDVAAEIALLDADNTPMVALLMQLNKHPCTDVKFEWQEDVFPPLTLTMTGTQSSSDTTLAMTNWAYMRLGDLWLNGDSGEVIYVSVAPTASPVTVVRAVGSTTATSIAATDNWFYIGTAAETGSQARAQRTTQITMPFNYAQLFKEPFEVTGTLNATTLYGGKDINYLRYKHAQVHQRDKERMCWFGVRDKKTGTVGSRPVHMSRGLIADGTNGFITTNESETNSSGEYTEDEFDVDLQTAFRYGSSTKFMFCSPMALSVVSSWGRDKLQTVPRANTMGVNITRYVSPHGELNLVNEKMFQDFSTAGSVWGEGLDYSKMAVILDMKNIYLRTLRDTILEMGIQENDRDSVEDQYMTECGLQVVNEEQCMAIYGFDLT